MPEPQAQTKNELPHQLPFYKRFMSNLKSFLSDLRLLTDIWHRRTEAFWGLILTSLVINLLSVVFPIVVLQVYDRIIPNKAVNTLILLLIGVAVALLIEVILKIMRFYLGGWADAKFEFLTSCKAFQRIVDSKLEDFEKVGSGVHIKRINSLNLLRDFYSGQAVISVIDVPFLLLFLSLIAYIGGWIVFIPIIILIYFIIKLIPHLKVMENILDKSQKQEDLRVNFIIETLSNIHSVKAMAMEAQMLRRYEKLQKKSAFFDHELSISNAKLATLTKSLSQLMIIAVVAFGSFEVMNGTLTIGGLAACMLLSTRCMQPISTIMSVWSRLKLVIVAQNELNTLLKMPTEYSTDFPKFEKVEGKIEFKNISFRYDDSRWILKNTNLIVKKNETISITGEGLSGKTTLLWLIMGLLSPLEGKILIDNKDISKYQMSTLREQIGYLPQKPILFHGTILENITMFQDEKYEMQAKRAANFIGVNKMINELPDGYNTIIAKHTNETLARGINQRIAIARAFLHEPPIVLFDEANASIDLAGDKVITNVLSRIKGKCTLVLVSHRPSVLNLANKNYILKNSELRLNS